MFRTVVLSKNFLGVTFDLKILREREGREREFKWSRVGTEMLRFLTLYRYIYRYIDMKRFELHKCVKTSR